VAIMDKGRIVALDTPRKLIAGLGGGIIHLGMENGGIEEKVLGQILSLPAVKSATRFDGKIKVETVHAQEALVHLLELLNLSNTHITGLQVLEPNLETVFLHLTGKQLRD
jgi:ABC-2 type transport system ATP-binding protein